MLLTKTVTVKLNSRNIQHYENLGHKMPRQLDNKERNRIPRGSEIEVQVKDLSKGSHVLVKVKCDYCDTIKEVPYKEYLRDHDEEFGDCCTKHRYIKAQNTMIQSYGTHISYEIPGVIDKVKETNLQKYGTEWQMQSSIVQQKSRESFKEKYGVEHALQHPLFMNKFIKTMSEKESFASNPQIEIYRILKDKYKHCYLEYPYSQCLLDCLLIIDDVKIDVEFDGKFWHKDKNRDIRRDNFLRSEGFKILRIKGATKDEPLPTLEQLDEQIEKLLNGYNYVELAMD